MKINYTIRLFQLLLFSSWMMIAGRVNGQTVTTFSYTGGVQTFTIPPCVNQITLEVWGAEGGGVNSSSNTASGYGGKGGYAKGTLTVTPSTTLNIYVGGLGQSSSNGLAVGGYNGGGSGYASGASEPGNGGGGATDIRVNGQNFTDRVIVAGGGGGGGEDSGDSYGNGGGTTGVGYTGYDGSQSSAGTGGGFGFGATTGFGDGGGGGGGWYGGGTYSSTTIGDDTQGGGGGSGYVGSLTQNALIDGTQTMPDPAGTSMTGRSGHGFARLTYSLNGPVVSIVAPVAANCNGNNVTLNGAGVNSYTWLPVGSFAGSNSGTVTVAPSSNTTYTVQGTNAQGCVTKAVVTVTVSSTLPTISVNSSTSTTCLGKSVVLTASGALTHTWTNGVTNGVPFVPAATNVYTATGLNGCGSVTQTISVSVVPLPIGISATSSLVCQGKTVTLTPTGATAYTWAPGGTTVAVIVIAPISNGIYSVAATDGTCFGSASIAINTNPNPTITLVTTSSVLCLGESATLTATGANSYTWVNAPITGGSGPVTPTAATLFQVTGSNQFGCMASAGTVVLVKNAPVITAKANSVTVCSGGSSTLSVTGNATTYSWTTGSTTSVSVVSPINNSSYTVTGTDNSTGCSSSATVGVDVVFPVLPVSPSATICEGASITLTAGAGTNYQWTPGPSTIFMNTVKPSQSSTYTVSAMTTSNNVTCLATNTVLVGVNARPVVTAAASRTVMCRSKETVTLDAGGASTYLWSNNATTASVVFSTNIVQTHNFSVIGTDANGCKDTAVVSVKVDACTGLNEFEKISLGIYPNPNIGSFTVKADVSMRFDLTNELGQVVKVIELEEENNFSVTLEGLSSGIYFLNGQNNGQRITEKIVVTK